jgi:hypothetical protein
MPAKYVPAPLLCFVQRLIGRLVETFLAITLRRKSGDTNAASDLEFEVFVENRYCKNRKNSPAQCFSGGNVEI